ncbi:uncharacterized protein Ecym_7215 [Eremothecium cymbalariae DBVPG|uniref:Uncharacterized protein n=1 Tax=Eremothecium cymbalariae (strain CBS 270.75 / DBVPG 7215 / KCTC 17166 / NRRL Y-17582) TaxID=931890 RepID=G8JW46_ERECY|nr:hypothetical protein Ecym_7215 [Eremothecium cymbalariae DBVPG\
MFQFNDNSSLHVVPSSVQSGVITPVNHIPRSQSTSDLFLIPELDYQDREKKRKQPCVPRNAGNNSHFYPQVTRHSSMNSANVDTLASPLNLPFLHEHRRSSLLQTQKRSPLTPYQIQRSQMKQRFQFPNGESFTPRAQLRQKLPLPETPRSFVPQYNTRPKAHSMSNMPSPQVRVPYNRGPHQPTVHSNRSSPNLSASSRGSRQIDHSGYRELKSKIARRNSLQIHKSSSLVNVSTKYSSENSSQALRAMSAESLRLRTGPSCLSLQENITSSGHKVPTSALPSLPSFGCSQFTKSQSSTSIKTLSNPNTSSSSLSRSSSSLVRDGASGSITSASDSSQKAVEQQTLLSNNNISLHSGNFMICPKSSATAAVNISNTVAIGGSTAIDPPELENLCNFSSCDRGAKKQGSKFGSFIKKFIPGMRRKQKVDQPTNFNSSEIKTAPLLEDGEEDLQATAITVSSVSLGFEADNADESNDTSSTSSYDREAGSLFDIDLVFDTLLLKGDRHEENSPVTDFKGVSKMSTVTQSREPKRCSKVSYHVKQRSSLNNEIDYDLIHDFSKLRDFIDAEQNNGQQQKSAAPSPRHSSPLTPPPRSNRRPIFNEPSISQFFYNSAVSGNLIIDCTTSLKLSKNHHKDRLLTTLQMKWKAVHIDKQMPKTKSLNGRIMSCLKSSGSDSAVNCPTGNASPSNSQKSVKRLEFAEEIYVNDTYSHWEYRRSDKRFLKERKQLMTSMQGLPFVQSVKWELNEFKRNEMLVHPESKQNTQFFI